MISPIVSGNEKSGKVPSMDWNCEKSLIRDRDAERESEPLSSTTRDADEVTPNQAQNGKRQEKTPDRRSPFDMPPAGPHARPELINPDLTPGTGVLPDLESNDPNSQPTS
jgi:hypothetical protein